MGLRVSGCGVWVCVLVGLVVWWFATSMCIFCVFACACVYLCAFVSICLHSFALVCICSYLFPLLCNGLHLRTCVYQCVFACIRAYGLNPISKYSIVNIISKHSRYA